MMISRRGICWAVCRKVCAYIRSFTRWVPSQVNLFTLHVDFARGLGLGAFLLEDIELPFEELKGNRDSCRDVSRLI